MTSKPAPGNPRPYLGRSRVLNPVWWSRRTDSCASRGAPPKAAVPRPNRIFQPRLIRARLSIWMHMFKPKNMRKSSKNPPFSAVEKAIKTKPPTSHRKVCPVLLSKSANSPQTTLLDYLTKPKSIWVPMFHPVEFGTSLNHGPKWEQTIQSCRFMKQAESSWPGLDTQQMGYAMYNPSWVQCSPMYWMDIALRVYFPGNLANKLWNIAIIYKFLHAVSMIVNVVYRCVQGNTSSM